MLPFLSLISVAELGRNPTVKDEIATTGGGSTSALMFTYPVHQAADILFCRANLVPVGKDQLPHLELTRTIARRFNERYSAGIPYFPEPEALLSRAPLLLGLDGRKMGKSLGNSIPLAASADETAHLIRAAKTDSERRITYEPERRPEVSNLLEIASLSPGVRPGRSRTRSATRGRRPSSASSSTPSTSTSDRSAADVTSWRRTPASCDPSSSAVTHSRDRSHRQRSGAFTNSCTRPTEYLLPVVTAVDAAFRHRWAWESSNAGRSFS